MIFGPVARQNIMVGVEDEDLYLNILLKCIAISFLSLGATF